MENATKEDKINVVLYRCGWCGHPTQENGKPLKDGSFKKAVNIIKNYGDGRTVKVNGWCCPNGS